MSDEPYSLLQNAASATPDPERALRNLRSFYEKYPEYTERLTANLRSISLLFSMSQFLANTSISNPEILFDAVNKIHLPIEKESLRASLRKDIEQLAQPSGEMLMEGFRVFKKKILLLVTLRDILGNADIVESMVELSVLADVIVEEALGTVQALMHKIYGEPEGEAFSVIAVGKLGSLELNFSSDIDLLYVYGREDGETSGVATPHGRLKNRISNHEYYCKLGESLNRFLSTSTGSGFGYRVDLRLRPEGQKGSLAMSLTAYELYYESWGSEWERAVLLRARPIAGDRRLGMDFLDMISPFVYRKYLDFNAIDEIRRMKTKIDATFKKDDIKRGRGGIREIEFFVHALQLIYGGKEPLLRERSTLKGLHYLLQKNLIGSGDYAVLSDNYQFLRKLEHRLQQLNDLQTHSLPSAEEELSALGRKMGFPDRKSFVEDLENRRRAVRKIYTSLFIERKSATPQSATRISLMLSEELSNSELRELLHGYAIKDTEKVIRNIQHIRDSTLSFQTLRGQRLLGKIIPAFFHESLTSGDPDAALTNLASFAGILSSEEPYLDLFVQNKLLIPILVRIFSQSEYIAKTIMKRREYLELLGHEMFPRKTLLSLKEELNGIISTGLSAAESIRIFKQMEEIRLGVLFLDKKIDIRRLMRELSKVAEAVVSVCIEQLAAKEGLAVIGFGKLGGRELTFNSDLDLIFVCGAEVTNDHVKTAERLIRFLHSHTQDGVAYSVDTRLRPEGSKGPLVSTMTTFEDYYEKSARFWEFQALLKARPIAGDRGTGCLFGEMKKTVLREKGSGISARDIKTMRDRIQNELSKEAEGYDIKLGPGGLEELEFTVQYLQLVNAHLHDELLVQGTLEGIKRLNSSGVIHDETAGFMKDTYVFYRTLETILRLTNEPVLKETSKAARIAPEFTGFNASSAFVRNLTERRLKVKGIFDKFL
ncbi:MAG: bifunctional [glutamate--ammonia ligase]-adenylyl-L-tyrosine phosphorylase/[glutamate--ammonia-ligase] adenylyltransferase [Thermodesulfovibrionales bacterium]|jgi:glutamate-ammonia-ligase adenylyltransferase